MHLVAEGVLRLRPARPFGSVTFPLRIIVASALVLLATTDAADAQQLRGDEVQSVAFEGNVTFPTDSLARAIVTQETDCRSSVLIPFCWLGMDFALRRSPLRDRELLLDRTRLTIWYQRRGFLDVQVDTASIERRPGQADVVFRIEEGRPIVAASIEFVGIEDIDATGLLDRLPLQEGDRLSTLVRDATRDSLVQRLKDRGHAHADVYFRALRPAEDTYNAQATFDIEPGPLATYGTIEIRGIEELSQATIRRTLPFASGEVYRDSDIDEARARLFRLDIVRSASVEPMLDDGPDSIVPVTVLVQEGDARRVRAGGGWSSAECLNLEARWTNRNFLGGARVLQVRGRVGNLLAPTFGDLLCNDSGSEEFARLTGVAAIDLAQPWVFSTDNSLTTSIFAERQTLPDIFIRRAIGFQAALTRAIDPQTVATLFYRPERSELDADDVLYCSGFLVCTPEDIQLLEGANWLAPVGLNISRDRSDDLLNPRRGSRLTLDLEHAAGWTGSNFRYDRVVAEATGYESLGGPFVLAGRLRGGWVGSGAFEEISQPGPAAAIIHPQRRFFAGGANSVRGFAQSRLGPRVLFTEPQNLLSDQGAGCTGEEIRDLLCDAGVAEDRVFSELPTGGTRVLEGNAEIRFPLGSWLEGVAFTDFGQAWGAGEGMELSEVQFTPGFGLRFPSPVGPIRVDLAYRPRGEQDLSVITPQLRPCAPPVEECLVVDGTERDWARTNQLVLLGIPVQFLEGESRFQLHVSIGQAF